MKLLDDAYLALAETIQCCAPLLREQQAPTRGIEKPMRIEHHQPRLVPPPIPEPQEDGVRGREWVERTKSFASRASSRGSFSVRRTFNAYNGPRRPRIGAPTEFRHIENAMPRRTDRFRPLELSIYMPENQLSPILSHFGPVEDVPNEMPFPPPAFTHSRSDSAMSFRIPRKPVRSSSGTSGTSEWTAHYKPRLESLSTQQLLAALESELPKPPPPARLRSMTEPPAYQRVKSALHEKFELEQRLKDIEEIIEERKSIYLNSRPTSRALSRADSIYSESQEPMPPPPDVRSFTPVPTLPTAPSFAARVALPHADQRPRTAPTKTVHIPTRLKSFTEASAAFTTPSPSSTSSRTQSRPERSLPPPPPLPLVLQSPPPLRKKKSFSRVSTWLFPSSNEHARNGSLDSVTNTPKALTSREGFYQCVDLQQSSRRVSTSTVSTVSTLESELDEPTIPTTWTPDSSPGIGHKRDVQIRQFSIESERNEKSLELTKVRTFGEKEMGPNGRWRVEPIPTHVPGRNSVGVAF
ncbi:uncharacterized protein LY89DRAFT_740056 [Mollisia scopiformis]|uniref:Uncharacterized protein n=1 Tax=Mollisia scopiformis TaxID=149040 RepID=A0A132BD66_MOLSC|nr:uncharacterized protein LY89DRAFT_740056 [Mollisia scopiformis]KUJ10328.1 hypothetical protein LY89DRAFT_740056 [Mollisia scopiformis]